MAKYKLKLPVAGIDQLSDETSLLSDERGRTVAYRTVTNVDLDTKGNMNRRKGFTLKLAGSNYHSLYESKRGWLMVCDGEEMGVYNPTANTFTALVTMDNSYLTSFAELNGNMYFTNPSYKGMIRKDEGVVRTLGVPLPSTIPAFAATTGGSLPEGKYGITYSIIDDSGEESPLGPLVIVELTEQGAIQGTLFTTFPNSKYRIYMTSADGEELYQAAEFDADTAAYLVTTQVDGRRPATQYLSRLPFGYTIRTHGPRLYVATDDFIYYSEPFLPHLTNEANGFIPATGFVTMLQPVDGGIYIADQAGVRFYRGEDPSEFKVIDVSEEHVVFGTAITVPGEFLPSELGRNHNYVAVWLAPSGYQIGLPSGEVVRLHTKQVQLPSYVQGCAAFSTQDGRKQVITPVNSNVLADASVALDSTIG